MGFLDKFKYQLDTDENLRRARTGLRTAWKRLPSAAAQYGYDRFPIVQWLPHYNPRWIVSDFIAGMTVGIMMIPQALAYAKIATIPVEYGLYSAWLPSAIYVFLGSSKDVSTGPTAILGLLTSETIIELKDEGGNYSPQDVSSAIAMMVGIYSLLLGLFQMGFVLDYISLPVLTGFLSAASLTILSGQIPTLVGLKNAPTGPIPIIKDALSRVTQWNGPTCGIGFGCIAALYVLEFVGKRWSKTNAVIKILSSSRAVIVLFIFTTISFILNKDRPDSPYFEISKVAAKGIIPPKMPSLGLMQKVAMRAIAPLVTSNLEHLALGKAFARRSGYLIDTSQELFFLGIANAVNSLFGAVTVGGAMSRTAVNSECGVRSPLGGIFTSAFILLTLYKLAGVLFWIPKATLAAIIIMAVVHIFGPASLFWRYWRISFADFCACLVCFWVTLLVETEAGILSAVVFSIGYTMLRAAFSRVDIFSCNENKNWVLAEPNFSSSNSSSQRDDLLIPSDTILVQFSDAIFFPNAMRTKATIIENVQVLFEPSGSANTAPGEVEDRSWSVAGQKKIEAIRRRKQISVTDVPLNILVLDFGRVPFLDATGIQALRDLREELRKFAGPRLEIRFYGLSASLRKRFDRAEWVLVDGPTGHLKQQDVDEVYGTLDAALWYRGELMEHDLRGIKTE